MSSPNASPAKAKADCLVTAPILEHSVLPPGEASRRWPLPLGARRVLFICAAGVCTLPWVSPGIALALGVALALTHENPYHRISKHAAKLLLQACVVLLGFGMNVSVVLQAGRTGLLFAAGSISCTLALGYLIGRSLKINARTSALISSGTAICGGSAIAAVGSVINAAEGEVAVAMGTVFLLNAVALYLFPMIGHALHLSQTQFGTWAGIAIHDISSVVGAASQFGSSARQTATAIKLSRALWIVPVALGASVAARRKQRASGLTPVPALKVGRVQAPWFIGLFLMASAARTFLPVIARAAPLLSHVATAGLTLTLFLIGAGISMQTLKCVGWKPMIQGIALWLFISAGSLAVILGRLSPHR